MTKSATYRLGAGMLTFVFLLSNVGLPLVLASCPMNDTGTLPCSACNDQSAPQKITDMRNNSCCATVIAAEKNPTEFLQLHQKTLGQVPVVVLMHTLPDLLPPTQVASHAFGVVSPPPDTDIPILISSLLL